MSKFFKDVDYEQALKMGPKKFAENHLFPAMRREHGKGFAMETWNSPIEPGVLTGYYDDVNRKGPSCGTICCIGGTMSVVLPNRPYFAGGYEDIESLGAVLGLNYQEARDLFYGWTEEWPDNLILAFAEATTPSQKEKVAERAVKFYIKKAARRRKSEKAVQA